MASDVVMPRLSDSMEEGTVLNWLKEVGEKVEVGEEIVEIETDKANMAYESDTAGILIETLLEEGETAAIGSVIARIGSEGEVGSAPAPQPPPVPAQSTVEEVSGPQSGRPNASPLARRIAKVHDIDLAALRGSGPRGRISKVDVEKAIGRTETPVDSPVSAKGDVERLELTRLQQVIARRMSEAKATAPHFYLDMEVDMSAAVRLRTELRSIATGGEGVPSINDFVVKACATALREFPRANGAYRDGSWELFSRVNIGIAVAGPDSLVVPVVADADAKSLGEIARHSAKLAGMVRDGSITPPQLAGATFTISNLGMFGVSSFQAVIDTPQAAILAVGAVVERPAVRDGEVVISKLMRVTLSCDHRILYGADGARFLASVRDLLERPLLLLRG